jgi:hypothetical protein
MRCLQEPQSGPDDGDEAKRNGPQATAPRPRESGSHESSKATRRCSLHGRILSQGPPVTRKAAQRPRGSAASLSVRDCAA